MNSLLDTLKKTYRILQQQEEGEEHYEEEHEASGASLVVLFLFAGLLMGGVIREIKKKTGFPYTPLVFSVGIVLGFTYDKLGVFGQAIYTVSSVDPHGILLIFLPVLVFESGFNTDWHLFKKQFIQIIILAVPCVAISAVLLAFCLKIIVGYDDIFSWAEAFMFGAILSCTDTVAVVALLKEIGASKKFNSLIEGESLLNDATCMVLLTVSSTIAKGGSQTPMEIVKVFAELSLGGIALGIAFGAISAYWIRKIFNDQVLVVNITFFSCYLLYFLAENFDFGIKLSGIIALVAFGLFMAAFGKSRISSESDHAVHAFWTYIVYCAETIIFLLAGVIIGNKVFLNEEPELDLTVTSSDYIKVFYLYLCMLAVRFIVIAMFMPILKNKGYGLNWREVTNHICFFNCLHFFNQKVSVLSYGGLRGAIGIAFSLIVARDKDFSANLRQIVVFDMTGAAILTLLINGTTTGYLVKKLGIASTSQIKQKVMINFMEYFLEDANEYQQQLKEDTYLQAADWDKVSEMVGRKAFVDLIKKAKDTLVTLENEKKGNHITQILQVFREAAKKKDKSGAGESTGSLYLNINTKSDSNPELVSSSNLISSATPHFKKSLNSEIDEENENDEALIIEARDRYTMTLKGIYYQLFEVSQCKPDTYILLVESANWDLDNDSFPLNSWDFISSSFVDDFYIRILNYIKNIPLVGRLAKVDLVSQLLYTYDVISTYLMAHEKVEKMISSFPIPEEIMQVIQKESEENRKMAEDYLQNYITVSFPEITVSIQNLKAAHSLLTHQKELVEETHARGQIDEKEFMLLKRRIDSLVMHLNEHTPEWKQPPLKQFLKTLPFFSFFTDEEINEVVKISSEVEVLKDAWMMKEGQKASKLFVITRGVGTESCKSISNTFKEKKGVGAVISMHHLISTTLRYETGFLADSVVTGISMDLSLIKEKVKLDKKLQEFVWRESLYFLTKLHPEDLKPLANLERAKLSTLLSDMTFKRVKKNATVEVSYGAIFLRGQAVQRSESDHDSPENVRKFDHLAVILPESGSKTTYLIAESYCWLFVSDNAQSLDQKILKFSDSSHKKSVFQQNSLRDTMLRGSNFRVEKSSKSTSRDKRSNAVSESDSPKKEPDHKKLPKQAVENKKSMFRNNL